VKSLFGGRSKVGAVILKNGAMVFDVAGAPTNGTSGTGAGVAKPGSFLIDSTNGVVYMNTNTLASPTWTDITSALTGVTAGVATASKAVVLDASGAIAGLLAKLGNAVTVQSAPLLGLPADVTGQASGTTQSTFYPLSSITIPANALSVNGKGIEFQFAGTTAANANAKDFRLHFGTATVTLTTGNTGNAQPFVCYGVVYRTGAGAQVVVAAIIIGTASPVPIVSTAAADETAAWTFSIESQNTAAAAASATGKFGQVTFQN
jgi:hypothetical protein